MRLLIRLARRVVKPFSMVAVVGLLSLSMIGAQPAYAADVLTKHREKEAFEAIIKANFKTIQPAANVALAAASVTPVGLGIRVLQLGMLAYSTSDLWMPFVAGTFGAAEGAPPSAPAPSGTRVHPGYSFSSVQQVNSNVWQVNGVLPYSDSSTNWTGIALKLSCKNRTTGAVTLRDWHSKTNFGVGAAGRSTYLQVYCGNSTSGGTATNEDVVGGVIGAFGSGDPLSASCYASGNTTPGCYWPGPDNVYRWGTQLGTSSPGFDPFGADVKYKVRSECIAPDGTKSTVEAESSGDYMKMPSCAAAGKGHGTGKTSIVGLAPGTTTEKPLWDSPAAPSDPATPLCDASRASDGCVLSVELDGKQCTAGNVECENWAEVNQNDPNKDTANSRLKCRLGPYTLPMAQCAMLEKAYLTGGTTWSDANTDGDPSTSGAPTTAPSGSPAAKPSAPPAPAPAPAPGAAGSPAPGSDSQAAACWPTGWGMLNPLEWVYKPVVCAAQALFQPKKDLQTRVNTMSTQFSNKIPMSWFGVGVEGVSAGSCPTNWAVTYKGTTHSLICGTPAEGIIRDFRPALGAMLTIAMLWPLFRSLFYSAIPVFKVTPS